MWHTIIHAQTDRLCLGLGRLQIEDLRLAQRPPERMSDRMFAVTVFA